MALAAEMAGHLGGVRWSPRDLLVQAEATRVSEVDRDKCSDKAG